MEDLDSISRAIQDVVRAPNQEDESTFTQLVQDHLRSHDSNVRHLVLEILQDVIIEGSEEEITIRRQFIFGENVLSYLPILLPLRADEPELVRSLLIACFETCSPKEAILALNEACQLLEERAGRVDVSDEEMDMEEDDDNASAFPADEEVDPEELVNDFQLIIKGYSTSFRRMPAVKSLPPLLTSFDAITSALGKVIPGSTSSQAATLSVSMAGMIVVADAWISERSTDRSGESRLLRMSITILIPRTQPKLMQTWFLRHFPKMALKDASSRAPETDAETDDLTPLEAFESTANFLGDKTPRQIAVIQRNGSDSTISPFETMSAMILIAYKLSPATTGPDMAINNHLPAVDDMMVLLSAGLGGVATDAAGTLLWDAVYRAKVGEIESASTLIEILMPLVTSDPDDLNRLAWFKLIQTLVEKANPGLDQIFLLEQLLEPSNPYDTLRPQALSILRTLLGAAARVPPSSSTSPNDTLFQPSLLTRLPLLPSSEHLSQSTSEFLSTPSATFVTEQLMTIWLLHQLDRENSTGVRGPEWIMKMRRSVQAVEAKCVEMRAELAKGGVVVGSEGGHSDQSWIVQRLEAAVERLKEIISGAVMVF